MSRRRLPWNFKTLILYENPIYRKMRYHGRSKKWSNRTSAKSSQIYSPGRRKVKIALSIFAGVTLIFGFGFVKGCTYVAKNSQETLKEGVEAKAFKNFVRDLISSEKSQQNNGSIDKAIDSFFGK